MTLLLLGFGDPAGFAATKKPCAPSLTECPKEGCGGGDQRLNRLKNRTDIPNEADVEEWSVPQIIDLNEATPEKWTRNKVRTELEDIGEGIAVRVSGYLIEAHTTKTPETCNCFLKGAANNDIHLNLVNRSTHSDERAVVLEITPRLRDDGWTVGTK